MTVPYSLSFVLPKSTIYRVQSTIKFYGIKTSVVKTSRDYGRTGYGIYNTKRTTKSDHDSKIKIKK